GPFSEMAPLTFCAPAGAAARIDSAQQTARPTARSARASEQVRHIQIKMGQLRTLPRLPFGPRLRQLEASGDGPRELEEGVHRPDGVAHHAIGRNRVVVVWIFDAAIDGHLETAGRLKARLRPAAARANGHALHDAGTQHTKGKTVCVAVRE